MTRKVEKGWQMEKQQLEMESVVEEVEVVVVVVQQRR